MKVPKILYKAQRQYRHNMGDDTLISGFDFEETIRIVNNLLERSDNSDYASAVKKLIDCNVDCVETVNGKYIEYDGVIDCLNLASQDFA